MRHVSIEDVAVNASDGGVDRRGLSEPLNTTDVAINRYVLSPGERISSLHAHMDQEVVFVVLDGVLRFETWTPDDDSGRSGERIPPGGEVTVGAGEAIRFAPGEFQSGRNDADPDTRDTADDDTGATDAEAIVLVLGAPHDSEAVRIPLPYPDCGHIDRRPGMNENGETPVLVCPDCGAAFDATCPNCASADMGAVLTEDRTEVVGVCRECGAEASA